MHLAAQKRLDRIAGTPACRIVAALDRMLGKGPGMAAGSDAPVPGRVASILVIKLVAMGDAVLLLTVLHHLRAAHPGARITVLTSPRAGPVLSRSREVDEVLVVDVAGGLRGIGELARVAAGLRRRRFDVAVDLEQYYRLTTLLARVTGAPRRLGFAIPGQGRAGLFTHGTPYRTDRHELLTFMDALRPAGLYCADETVELVPFPVEEEERRRALAWLRGAGCRAEDLVVALHPGSGPNALSRRWPAYGFAAVGDHLAGRFGARIIVTGDRSEEALGREVAGLMRRPAILATGATGLGEFAALLGACDLFVTNDSGPMHLAASMGTPVLGLFGPNIPDKWRPWGADHRVVMETMRCSPCTRLDLDRVSDCRDNQCMKLLAPEAVTRVAAGMLEARRERRARMKPA